MITIVETSAYLKKAEKLMSTKERTELIDTIAADPKAGDVIPKTGGIRKLRFAQDGQGKSGSFRVIYYYYNDNNPVLLFAVFGKNQKSNLNDKEKLDLYQIVQDIKKVMKP